MYQNTDLDEITADQIPKRPNNDFLRVIMNVKQLNQVKWDPDSPKFQLACTKLGIDAKSELQVKSLDDFKTGNIEKEIADLRHKHHMNRVRETLNQIIVERQRLKGIIYKTCLITYSHYRKPCVGFLDWLRQQNDGVKSRKLLIKLQKYAIEKCISCVLKPRQQHNQTTVEPQQSVDMSPQNQNNNSILSQLPIPGRLLNPNIMFRDLKVKILRNKKKEDILKKYQDKLIKSKENLDYISQVQEEKKKQQEQKREKHNERYQKIVQSFEEKSVMEFRRQLNQSRNQNSSQVRTYSNNSPMGLSKPENQNNNLSDFEKFQISYQQQQQRIQQILDNSAEMRKLQSIESKLQRSSQNYEYEMALRRQRASERNRTQEDRYRQISEIKRKQDEENLMRLQMQMLNQEKKAQEKQREQQEFQEYKLQQKAELKEKLMQNKSKEEGQNKSRLNQLLQKFERAEQHRHELKSNMEYQNKIKQEKRRLKEDDTLLTQERQKRQRQNQKMQILLKQSEHEQNILMKQAQDEEVRRMKRELEMKVQIQKLKIRNTFIDTNGVTKSIQQINEIESQLPRLINK